ncbi:hypothetical protein DRO29_06145 [Candidatus Bathyarchaeota archaeon]|nr:MAG: hypothetical protein DRO29_06145 [Candidatus Bathyarchaeota archaeon]
MSTKRRFGWLKVGTVYSPTSVEIEVGGRKLNLAGKPKKPICAKCGKKIRDLSKAVRKGGKYYHERCLRSNKAR